MRSGFPLTLYRLEPPFIVASTFIRTNVNSMHVSFEMQSPSNKKAGQISLACVHSGRVNRI